MSCSCWVCQRHTLACLHVISCPAGNVTYLAASCNHEKAGHARCSPVASVLTPRHNTEFAAAHKPPHLWHHMGIQNTDNLWNMGQREKEYQHFLLSEFDKKTWGIPQFLQITAMHAERLCLCFRFMSGVCYWRNYPNYHYLSVLQFTFQRDLSCRWQETKRHIARACLSCLVINSPPKRKWCVNELLRSSCFFLQESSHCPH